MFEQERKLFQFNTEYLRQLLQGLEEERLWRAPATGVHPAGWILGHLAITMDYAIGLLGGSKVCPSLWGGLFGPRTSAFR